MSRSEETFEELVADMLADTAPSRPPSDLIRETERALDDTRRRPPWFALIKESPMRFSSAPAVGSPTLRVVAILAATLLLAVSLVAAGVAGSRLLAADGAIIVDQTGGGTVTTITEAVAMADDGDTILIRPGTYEESVTISDSIEVRGDADDRSEVVVRIPADGPTTTMFDIGPIRYAFALDDSHARLAGLTLTATGRGVVAIVVRGGAPIIDDVVVQLIDVVGIPRGAAYVGNAAAGAITNSEMNAFVWLDEGSTMEVTDNVTSDVIRTAGLGTAPHIIGNQAVGIWAHDGSSPIIDGNVVRGTSGPGCGLESLERDTHAVITHNTVEGHSVGICVDGSATIEGNLVVDNDSGIQVRARADVTLRENEVSGNVVGVTVRDGSVATMEGNTICDNETNVIGPAVGEDIDTSENEICPDATED